MTCKENKVNLPAVDMQNSDLKPATLGRLQREVTSVGDLMQTCDHLPCSEQLAACSEAGVHAYHGLPHSQATWRQSHSART